MVTQSEKAGAHSHTPPPTSAMTDVIGYGGQRFNRLAGGGGSVGVPGIDVGEALKGCCNGIFKFAYIVSAPLQHYWAST